MAVARFYDHDAEEWVLLAAGRDGASGASSWDELTGKPATFPPESHTHSQSEVDGLEAALSGKAESSRLRRLRVVSRLSSVAAVVAPAGPYLFGDGVMVWV